MKMWLTDNATCSPLPIHETAMVPPNQIIFPKTSFILKRTEVAVLVHDTSEFSIVFPEIYFISCSGGAVCL